MCLDKVVYFYLIGDTKLKLSGPSFICHPNYFYCLIQKVKQTKTNPTTKLIIIPTATTTTLVLILKTTMITLKMVTLLVSPLPILLIATLIMPLLEEIK